MSETVVTRATAPGMITLRGAMPVLSPAVQATLGCPVPEMRLRTSGAGGEVLWMSPDELLLLCPEVETQALARQLETSLADEFATVAVVSDMRAVFDIIGPHAETVITKLAPVDFAAMAPAEVRRTRLAQVAAALWRVDGGLRVICFRSVADYVEALLRNAVPLRA